MRKVKAMLLSAGIMTVISVVLLMVISLILEKTRTIPRSVLPVLTTVTGCGAVFLGAFFSSVYAKERGALFGILSGLVYAFCIALVSALAFQNEFTISSAGKSAAFLLSGSIGGILGVNRKKRVKF